MIWLDSDHDNMHPALGRRCTKRRSRREHLGYAPVPTVSSARLAQDKWAGES